MVILKKSLCTAYKSTVQTEQAMNFKKVRGAGPKRQQDGYIPVGQFIVLRFFYTHF
ncbi:hypothetical protein KPL49_11160 [Clostridium estertheticum]|nr:hypothetical protein [Clostridium estertheticum]MBU3185037.1 hypothetical protein [Clostridium estertheticum]MBZ9614156.1 hypothetical protein [Clostridium estertheticum subsp. laramiense]